MHNPGINVLFRFLGVLYKHQPLRKTALQQLARLNNDMCSDYIRWTVDRNMIKAIVDAEGKEHFTLTESGRKVYEGLVTALGQSISN